MSAIAIKVENLSKMYRLGNIGTGSLGSDLTSWWASVRGKEDPNSKIAIGNDRSQKSTSDFVWSLKDINFEIKKGDAVGIIGKNGAGKSTLLKILSRTTSPTTGNISINGRIASLLEVGTGFHGDLSGRENIFMNGSILGMARHEIKSKLDEIIDFSGVAGYIDTPVKRYSSGMYVRLAFAVAAHLDPEIMIVDEVLAVGDAEFQKKCLGKMKDVNNKEGRTVLFVSHNIQAIKTLCNKGIHLFNGSISNIGDIHNVISSYEIINAPSSKVQFNDFDEQAGNENVRIHNVELISGKGSGQFNITEPLKLIAEISNLNVGDPINVNFFFNTNDGVVIFATCSEPKKIAFGKFTIECEVPSNLLNDNLYNIEVMVVANSKVLLNMKDILTIEGIEPARNIGWLDKFPGLIKPKLNWTIKETNHAIL